MEALMSAYGAASDHEGDEGEDDEGRPPDTRPAKRGRLVGPLGGPTVMADTVMAAAPPLPMALPPLPMALPPLLTPLPAALAPAATARYVSKREKAQAAAAEAAMAAVAASLGPPPVPCAAASAPPPVLPLPGPDPILSSQLPKHMHRRLSYVQQGAVLENYLPKRLLTRLHGHDKGVNAVRWSPTHGCLLASAGVDKVVHIWNAWNGAGQQRVRSISSHAASVRDVQWTPDGDAVLTCGFDKSTRLTDVETGTQKQVCLENNYVNVAKFHPHHSHTFLSGGSDGALRLWDLRSGKQEAHFSNCLGQILDLDFHHDGRQFVSSSDLAQRNASEKALVVWNFDSQVPLSNQVYLEAYTCPAVRYHPHEDSFIAQSNGNYIAIFSARPPFKMNKYKRYEGHQVAGFPILCNFSPDGEYVVTGSADGSTCLYSWRTSKMLRRLEMPNSVCTDAAYHPFMPSIVASCSWEGMVCVYT